MVTRLAGAVAGGEADLLDHLLQHGLQPAGADVLDRAVHRHGGVGQGVDGVVGEGRGSRPRSAISAWCWRIRLASGSVRMRRRSSRVSAFSSTRIGRRPCSSGSRSEGLATWKAPEAMNRMWSVFTGPYLVETVVPSISGSRSRCTPSRETSAPARSARRGHLVDLVDEDDAVVLGQLDAPPGSAPPGRAACRSPRRSAAPRRRRRWSCGSWCARRTPCRHHVRRG